MGCSDSKVATPTPKPRTPSPKPRTPPPTPPPPPPPRQNTEDFASDTVDIKFDDRNDEVSIPVQERNDPAPCPSDQNNNIKISNHFFDDEDFQLASDSADIRELDNVEDDIIQNTIDSDLDDASIIPQPPGKHVPKISFEAIDEHARQAKDNHADSFQNLMDYLTKSLGDDNREIKIARAIVVWLSQQDVDGKNYGQADVDSPKGLLQHLKCKTMTYATCYTILCRSAGLTCTLVKGIVKAAGYEPGDTEAPSSPWTAVFADGSWRIVHPFWICRALFGHSLAGWVKIEQDGKSTSKRTKASNGVTRNAFQENYFMPKPENFVHECFPVDTRWELLPDSLMIKTKLEFFEIPYLLPPFFGLGLELTSDRQCHLRTRDGFCQVQIKAKGSNSHMLVLVYELFAKESNDFDPNKVQRMVFNSRSNEFFAFDIRFPCRGVFKLVIYGGPFKSPLLRLCEFKITCEKEISGIDLLPLSGGNIGFGPGPVAVDAGLFLPSRPNGLIAVPKNNRKTQISFFVQKEALKTTTFSAILTDGISGETGIFEKYVRTEIIQESRRLNITVSLPGEGEFGLQITSKKTITRVVCNYLLSTTLKRMEKANEKNAKAKLRENVKNLEEEKSQSNWKNQLSLCDRSISNCLKQGVDPSDEDLCMAETTVELYRYKNALRDGITRRNLHVLARILQLVKKYKNKMAITEEIKRTEFFKDTLKSLMKLSKEAPSKEAFSYLLNGTAPPEVESIYRAVLLLLHCAPSDIKTWDQIGLKLGSPDHADSRLREIHAAEIPKLQREKAKDELSKFEREEITLPENEHVAALHDWGNKKSREKIRTGMGCCSAAPIPPVTRLPLPKPVREGTEDFSSNTVDIKYDTAEDKVKIQAQERNDPRPTPADSNNNIKITNHFFDDEDFQVASDDADFKELDNINDESNMSDEAQLDRVSIVPKPAGRHVTNLSFTDIDSHAKNALRSHASSFESLKNYLTEILGTEYREIRLARALVVWLSQQDIDNTDYDEVDTNSPRGLLHHLKSKSMTYATCYTILCRSAGLSCALIKGIVKAASYEPGDTNAPSSPWTAVFADGSWRIVHPFWICRALFGHSLAGWVKIEQDGKSTNQRTQASKGVTRNAFQDNYFMPKPENFIYECFPNDTRWELLPESLQVKTKSEFFDMPYLLPPFFGLGLQLISEPRKCHLQTKDGLCQIKFKAKGSSGHMIVLTYEFFEKASEDYNPKDVQRMVFNSRSNEYFIFDIRFPCTGVFKLVIYGGPYKSPLLRLCEFKITCEKAISRQNLLPIPGGRLGFGPGPVAAEAGLFLPSRPNGLIAVPNNTRKTEISFFVKKEVIMSTTFSAILTDNKSANDTGKFEEYGRTEVLQRSSRLNISVLLPKDGNEFGLMLTSTKINTRVVCNYLLSTIARKYEKANVKKAKQNLREIVHTLEKDSPLNWGRCLKECEKSIKTCHQQRVDLSDEDVCMAETAVELYKYKKALRDGIIRRNIRVLDRTLEFVRKYKNKMVITEEITRAEHFKEFLISLKTCSGQASGLVKAFSFLSSDSVSDEIQTVYKAVLYLFRHSPNEIKTWEQVQWTLESAEVAVRRLAQIHATDILKTQIQKSENELRRLGDGKTIQEEDIFELFKWVQSVLDIYQKAARLE